MKWKSYKFRGTASSWICRTGCVLLLLLMAVGSSGSLLAQDAEQVYLDELRKLLVRANLLAEGRNYGDAAEILHYCVALGQEGTPWVKGQSKELAALIQKCWKDFERVEREQKLAAFRGGWEGRLKGVIIPVFEVRDATLETVLQHWSERVEALHGEAPNLVFAGDREKLGRLVTLEVRAMSAGSILYHLSEGVGWKIRYEERALVLKEPPRSIPIRMPQAREAEAAW